MGLAGYGLKGRTIAEASSQIRARHVPRLRKSKRNRQKCCIKVPVHGRGDIRIWPRHKSEYQHQSGDRLEHNNIKSRRRKADRRLGTIQGIRGCRLRTKRAIAIPGDRWTTSWWCKLNWQYNLKCQYIRRASWRPLLKSRWRRWSNVKEAKKKALDTLDRRLGRNIQHDTRYKKRVRLQ